MCYRYFTYIIPVVITSQLFNRSKYSSSKIIKKLVVEKIVECTEQVATSKIIDVDAPDAGDPLNGGPYCYRIFQYLKSREVIIESLIHNISYTSSSIRICSHILPLIILTNVLLRSKYNCIMHCILYSIMHSILYSIMHSISYSIMHCILYSIMVYI